MNWEINGFLTNRIHGGVKKETWKFTSQRRFGSFLQVGKNSYTRINQRCFQPSTLKCDDSEMKMLFRSCARAIFMENLSARLFLRQSIAAVLFLYYWNSGGDSKSRLYIGSTSMLKTAAQIAEIFCRASDSEREQLFPPSHHWFSISAMTAKKEFGFLVVQRLRFFQLCKRSAVIAFEEVFAR